MSPRARNTPVALTIAGSDSGGGAGIQTDLKTFSSLGVFGTSAITCLTAQNPCGVSGIKAAPKGFVAKQIESISKEFPVLAAKTGMLFSARIIAEVVQQLKLARIPLLVVDPVARATSGASLLKPKSEESLINDLLPLATVITPNIPEAEMILKDKIRDADDQMDAARAISKGFGVSCLLKGGHMENKRILDVLCHKKRIYKIEANRVKALETHGTGCTLSAALTAYLAKGMSLPQAAGKSCDFVQNALRNPFHTGTHYPLGIRP